MEHLSSNNLLSDEQYGFRPGRSCATQLLNVLQEWTDYIECNESWDTVYLDLAKAFDKVSHTRLINKIKSFGIDGHVISWLEDFLKNRQQCVSINSKSSSWKNVDSGVPQGSVLGPVMFILYVNDIPEHVKSLVKIFADDTKLYGSASNYTELQNDLDSLVKWAKDWELTFNVDKCKVMHYGQNNNNHEYTMDGKILKSTEDECDLGVIFQKDLKFSKHIATKINKANSILSLLSRSFKYIDKYAFLKLYTALIRPHVEFANVIWYPHLRKDIESIERFQMRATKLIPVIKDLPYEERLRALKLPSLAHRRLRGDAIQTFKIIKKTLMIVTVKNSSRYLSLSNTRGHSYKLEKPRCVTSCALNQFSNRVVNLWNTLPQTVVDAKNVDNFKIRLDKHFPESIKYQY